MTIQGRAAIFVLVALALSLALNFAWLGFSAAHSFRDRSRPLAAERLVAIGARSLPDDLRKGVADALAPKDGDVRAAMREVRDARRALFESMRADPLDRAAVAGAFATLRSKRDAVSAIGETAILDALEQAPANVRAEIRQPPARGPAAN